MMENDFILLRPPEIEDLDTLYQWENDPDIWAVSHTITPFSKYILKKYIENSHLDIYETKQFRFMIDLKHENKNESIGTIDLFDFDPYNLRIGIGVLIKEDKHRQKGYASDALILLIDYCFKTLQVHQIFCNIKSDNEASLQLFKKHGFEIAGLKKEWLKTSHGWGNEYLLQLINRLI